MIRLAFFYILLLSMALAACYGGEQSDLSPTWVGQSPSSARAEGSTPAPEPQAEATPTTPVAPLVRVETDRHLYKEGESIIITVKNNSTEGIRFLALCSLHLCVRSGQDWICVERECDGQMTIIDPGDTLELLGEATSIAMNLEGEVTYRYKLDYQIIFEEPYQFSQSNEFVIEADGVTCKMARQTALQHAQSSPYRRGIDASRAIVRWLGEDQSCHVIYAGRGAEEIGAGLWSEGFSVIVDAASGQVLETRVFER